MEVLLGLLVVTLIVVTSMIYKRNIRLSHDYNNLESSLDSALDDHRLAEQELRITNSKLQSLKEIALTPDNAIPRDLYAIKLAEIDKLKGELTVVTSSFESARGKAISERVRLGHVSENFAAFLDEFPYDRSKVKALFQPVDLIYFGDDEVVFIDVKSGESQLSTKQRNIKRLIENGKVRFEVHRINDKGYDIK